MHWNGFRSLAFAGMALAFFSLPSARGEAPSPADGPTPASRVDYDVAQSPFILKLLFGVEAEETARQDLTFVSFHDPKDREKHFDRKLRITYRTATRTVVHLCTPLMTLVGRILQWNSQGVEVALNRGSDQRAVKTVQLDRGFLDAHGQELLPAFDQCVAAESAQRAQGLTDFARRHYAKLRMSLAKEETVVVEVSTGASRTLASEQTKEESPTRPGRSTKLP